MQILLDLKLFVFIHICKCRFQSVYGAHGCWFALDPSRKFQGEKLAVRRGFLRGEHSTRRMRKIRSNMGDVGEVVEAVRFILRK